MTVSWDTDKPSNTQVRYGTSLQDGKDVKYAPAWPPADIETDKTHAVTAHTVTITGLSADSAEYRFVVLSRDRVGNLAVSAEHKLVPNR